MKVTYILKAGLITLALALAGCGSDENEGANGIGGGFNGVSGNGCIAGPGATIPLSGNPSMIGNFINGSLSLGGGARVGNCYRSTGSINGELEVCVVQNGQFGGPSQTNALWTIRQTAYTTLQAYSGYGYYNPNYPNQGQGQVCISGVQIGMSVSPSVPQLAGFIYVTVQGTGYPVQLGF